MKLICWDSLADPSSALYEKIEHWWNRHADAERLHECKRYVLPYDRYLNDDPLKPIIGYMCFCATENGAEIPGLTISVGTRLSEFCPDSYDKVVKLRDRVDRLVAVIHIITIIVIRNDDCISGTSILNRHQSK
jgi:hypothetical protein